MGKVKSIVGGLTILVVVGTMLSCSSAPAKKIPSWYENPPEDPNYLFSATTATSRDLQLAVEKAKQDARVDISAQLEARVMGLIKKFDEEVGRTESSELLSSYSKTSKTVVDQTLVGARAKYQKVVKDGELYRAYVLMELPLGLMKKLLVDKIKRQQELYTRFRASQSFKELEKEVEKYRQFKKEQAGE